MMNEKSKELVKTEATPNEMITMAIEKGANLDQIEKLLVLHERFEANEARKAYHKAMAEFKEHPPVITKDKDNKQYGSKYTSLNNLVNTVNPALSKCGLSASWDIEQNGIIKVVCKITHCLGHSEHASMTAEADTSGAKNKIQQIKSTITYLKGVTFESICGLASSDANLDDDGESGGKDKPLDVYDEVVGRCKELFKTVEEKKAWFEENKIIKAIKDMNDSELSRLLEVLNDV